MLYWACAQTHPHEEALALRNLTRQKFNAFYPFFAQENRFRRMTVKPVFPGYVFVELDDAVANWAPINSTLGVTRLLTQMSRGEYRRPCKAGFVEHLRKLQIRRDNTAPAVLPPGTIVRVTRGPFAEKTALVAMSTAERVRVLLECFNRDVTVEFDVGDVVLVRRPTAAVPAPLAYSYG